MPLTRRQFLASALAAGGMTAVAARLPATARAASLPASRAILFSTGLGGEYFSINPDGTSLRRLGHGVEPSWAVARGGIVSAIWDDSPTGIWFQDPDGGNRTLFVEGKEYLSPQMNPDGTQLTYLNRDLTYVRRGFNVLPDPTTGINVIGIGGEPARAPGGGPMDNFSPGWSPGGDWFLWQGDSGLYRSNVRILPEDQINEEAETRRVEGTDARYAVPRWSPDGQRIVLIYKQNDHWEVGTMSPWGRGLQLLTVNPDPFGIISQKFSPAWSPNGNQIAYIANAQRDRADFYLWLMNANGSNRRQISDLPIHVDYSFTRMVSWA